MSDEEISYSKKLSGLLASFTIIVMLGVNIFMSMTVNFGTMMFVFTKVLPIAIGIGYLGHLIGRILDNPRRK